MRTTEEVIQCTNQTLRFFFLIFVKHFTKLYDDVIIWTDFDEEDATYDEEDKELPKINRSDYLYYKF